MEENANETTKPSLDAILNGVVFLEKKTAQKIADDEIKVFSTATTHQAKVGDAILEQFNERISLAKSGQFLVVQAGEEEVKTSAKGRSYYKLARQDAENLKGEWKTLVKNEKAVVLERKN